MAGGQQQRSTARGYPEGQRFLGDKAQWGGIDQLATSRAAVKDGYAWWIENFIPIEDSIRALYGIGPALYNSGVPGTITNFYPFNIDLTDYFCVFKNDGSCSQIRISDGAATTLATAGTFSGSALPHMAQWGHSGIIIVSSPVSGNGYFAWDGTLYSPGASAPSWLDGGSATTMPTGISGTCVTTFQQRAWIGDGATLLTSAPENGADFSASSGGNSLPNSDPFLKKQYIALVPSAGFLYTFGDSSINVISNVVTSGSPATTTFSNNNVDPTVGTVFRDSAVPYGRAITFATPDGIEALYGSAVEKISDNLDNIFNTAGILVPSAGIAHVFGRRCVFTLVQAVDYTGTRRNMLMAWDGKRWFVASQEVSLTYVVGYVNSGFWQLWGTDTQSIYPLFTNGMAGITKTFVSKLRDGGDSTTIKSSMRAYAQIQQLNGQVISTIPTTIDSENGSQAITWNTVQGAATAQAKLSTVVNTSGQYLGITLSTTSPDFSLLELKLGHIDYTELG